MTGATDDEQRQGVIACCGEACIEGVVSQFEFSMLERSGALCHTRPHEETQAPA